MLFKIDETTVKRAKFPHELFMVNLAGFHLLMAPAAIVLNIGVWGFLVPLLLSLTVISFTWRRACRLVTTPDWFVAMHWRLAARRTRILLAAYAIGGLILGAGFMVAAGIDKKTTQDIMLTVFSRIAVVPVLLSVMVCFVLESGSIYQASRGEVADQLVASYPPPTTIVAVTADDLDQGGAET